MAHEGTEDEVDTRIIVINRVISNTEKRNVSTIRVKVPNKA